MNMNYIKLCLSAALIALFTSTTVVGTTGCAAIMPVIPKIVSVVTDALVIMGIIDGAVQEYFRTHPNTPPEVIKKYRTVYNKAMNALNSAQHALEGVEDLDQDQYDAAFNEFKLAFIELKELLSKEGLMQGNALNASPGTTVVIPEPEALTLEVD